jgi:acylphosphatase
MQRISLLIKGKVQGVFYRKSTAEKATEIGLTGFVKNLPDGNVYAEAQGTKEQLQNFINWCKRGPDRARVDDIVAEECRLHETEKTFSVQR